MSGSSYRYLLSILPEIARRIFERTDWRTHDFREIDSNGNLTRWIICRTKDEKRRYSSLWEIQEWEREHNAEFISENLAEHREDDLSSLRPIGAPRDWNGGLSYEVTKEEFESEWAKRPQIPDGRYPDDWT